MWKWSLGRLTGLELWVIWRNLKNINPKNTSTATSPNGSERQLLGKRDGVPQKERDRQMDRKRGEGFMKKEDKSLIDVENVETTGERCCHLS